MAKKTNAELAAENRLLRSARRSEGITSVINNVIKWSGLGFIFWCGTGAISSLSGTTTRSDIVLKLVTDLNANQWLCLILGGGGMGYGLSQRKVRKETVARVHARNEKLEQQIDPRRSTSSLTPDGETP